MKKLHLIFALLIIIVAAGAYRLGASQANVQICVDLPAAQSTRVIAGVASLHGYQAKVRNANGQEIDNPQNRRQFVREIVRRFLHESVKAAEANAAAEDARRAAAKKVDDEVIIP